MCQLSVIVYADFIYGFDRDVLKLLYRHLSRLFNVYKYRKWRSYKCRLQLKAPAPNDFNYIRQLSDALYNTYL